MKHDIDVRIRTPREEKGGVFVYAVVTVDDFIRFQVRGQTYADPQTGEEKSFFAYPSQKRGEEWQNVILADESLKRDIQDAIAEKIKSTSLNSSLDYLEKITKVSVHPIKRQRKQEEKVVVRAMADVEISGLKIRGIALKESKKGYFINMPQYLNGTGAYSDLAYGITKDAQQALKEAVLNEYRRIHDKGNGQNGNVQSKFQDLSKALKTLIEDGWNASGGFCVLPRDEYPESTYTLLQKECERERLQDLIQFEEENICLDMEGLAERYHFKLSSRAADTTETHNRANKTENEMVPRI